MARCVDVNEDHEKMLILARKIKTAGVERLSTMEAHLLAGFVERLHEHLAEGGELPKVWTGATVAVKVRRH